MHPHNTLGETSSSATPTQRPDLLDAPGGGGAAGGHGTINEGELGRLSVDYFVRQQSWRKEIQCGSRGDLATLTLPPPEADRQHRLSEDQIFGRAREAFGAKKNEIYISNVKTLEHFAGWRTRKYSFNADVFSVLRSRNRCVAVLQDGPRGNLFVAYADQQRSVLFPVSFPGIRPQIQDLSISPNGLLVAHLEPPEARVWDLTKGAKTHIYPVPASYGASAKLTWLRDGGWLALHNDESMHVWGLATGKQLWPSSK